MTVTTPSRFHALANHFCAAYPSSFGSTEDFFDVIGGTEQKLSRPLSVPGSPKDRSGVMTPGDFASLQEIKEGLSTEDYIAWKLP